jgi:hypothetical protein
MKLNTIEFPYAMFTRTGHQLHTEASDMGNRHLQPLGNGGVGFAVKLSTGEVVEYAMTDLKKDREGDITHWVYSPTAESQRLVPACVRTTALIWND